MDADGAVADRLRFRDRQALRGRGAWSGDVLAAAANDRDNDDRVWAVRARPVHSRSTAVPQEPSGHAAIDGGVYRDHGRRRRRAGVGRRDLYVVARSGALVWI